MKKQAMIVSRWKSSERQIEVETQEEIDEVENLAFDIHNPPINVIFD